MVMMEQILITELHWFETGRSLDSSRVLIGLLNLFVLYVSYVSTLYPFSRRFARHRYRQSYRKIERSIQRFPLEIYDAVGPIDSPERKRATGISATGA